jgi:hypothetical protein
LGQPLWTATALALISEINHQHHEDRKSTTAEELKDCVNTIIATMGLSAPFCHLMGEFTFLSLAKPNR